MIGKESLPSSSSLCLLQYTSGMTPEVNESLQRVQNYCVKFIFNSWERDNVPPFYHESLVKIKALCECHTLYLLYSILLAKSPDYLFILFTFLPLVSGRSTRRGASSIYTHRTSVLTKSFSVVACHLGNSLPDTIITIDRGA